MRTKKKKREQWKHPQQHPLNKRAWEGSGLPKEESGERRYRRSPGNTSKGSDKEFYRFYQQLHFVCFNFCVCVSGALLYAGFSPFPTLFRFSKSEALIKLMAEPLESPFLVA